MVEYYDRYKYFRDDNNVKMVPNIKIEEKSTDKQIVYKKNQTRLDKVSQEYYGSPFYGWLILLANPEFGGMEFSIPNNSILRIPLPFRVTIEQYENQVQKHLKNYGS